MDSISVLTLKKTEPYTYVWKKKHQRIRESFVRMEKYRHIAFVCFLIKIHGDDVGLLRRRRNIRSQFARKYPLSSSSLSCWRWCRRCCRRIRRGRGCNWSRRRRRWAGRYDLPFETWRETGGVNKFQFRQKAARPSPKPTRTDRDGLITIKRERESEKDCGAEEK